MCQNTIVLLKKTAVKHRNRTWTFYGYLQKEEHHDRFVL